MWFCPIQVPAPLPSQAVSTAAETRILDGSGKLVKTIPSGSASLRWSPNGRLLARLDRSGEVTVIDTAGSVDKPSSVTTNAVAIDWISDSKLLIGLKGSGTAIWTQGAKTETVVKIGQGASVGYRGATLAFGVDGSAGGLWLASADGSHSHRIARGKHCSFTSWSYDGQLIAAVIDGHLLTIQPNGFGSRDLGEVDDANVLWSAGSPYLLARRKQKWSVWNALRDTWTDLAFDADSTPQWTGAKALAGIEHSSVYTQSIGKPESALIEDPGLTCFARSVGVYMGESFPDPLREIGRLPVGSKALVGSVVSWDPSNEQLQVAVESEFDARGRELNLPKADLQLVKVTAREVRGRKLLPETRLRVVVSKGRATQLMVPDELEVTPDPGVKERFGRRPARYLEYDGISMDRVVVPMIYPIPGRHHDADSFLNAREGHRHQGNDLMAPKMTPLLAVFDGTVYFHRTDRVGVHNTLALISDDGWTAVYMHINNDNPGTDDDAGSFRYAFPADLQSGDRVKAGQLVAYCGNSGNAKYTDPHLHFELHDEQGGGALDPYYSLQAAKHIPLAVYDNPDPSLKRLPGEERWDGVVVSVDPQRSVLTVELCAQETHSMPLRRIKIPRYAYFQLTASISLRSRDLTGLTYSLDSVKAGLLISAVGCASDSKLSVRDCSVALPTH